MSPTCSPKPFVAILSVIQVILLVLYALFVDYADNATATGPGVTQMDHVYPMYQDVHVMIFAGFGFLMTFLKKYGFSSIGLNFLLSAVVIQWSILIVSFWHQALVGDGHWHVIELNIKTLVGGDFAAGSVMISFGALLGKATPTQLIIMAIIHNFFYALNEGIGAGVLQAVDMGGSMFVHMFGAYFGLACAWALGKCSKNAHPDNQEVAAAGSSKTSDLFAMIGTVFLWMYWPSFNGALSDGNAQHRVVINTVLALCGSCVSAYMTSMVLRGEGKFNMVDIQNATLAGGVAVGSSADLMVQPWGAMLIGMIAGFVSTFGYVHIQPLLTKAGFHDTCGVHNLHGIPGIMGALAGAISAGAASDQAYGEAIGLIFPARAPSNATLAALSGMEPGKDRTAQEQAVIQYGVCMMTLGISIVGGLVTGLIIGAPCFGQQEKAENYEDETYWMIEEDEEEEELHEKAAASNDEELHDKKEEQELQKVASADTENPKAATDRAETEPVTTE